MNFAANSGHSIGGDRDARRGAVSAEPQQEIAALRESAVQVERADRTTGTLPLGAIEGDEHRRTSELLDDARRDDADHAGVPALLRQHDAVGRRKIHREHQRARLLERRAIDLLPARVELLELTRDRVGLLLVRREHQLDAAQRAAESARGVESRREDEADAARRQRFPLEARRANHRADARTLRLVEQLEPVAHEHAIFAAQRRDVGDRRERHEIEHAVDGVLVAADRARQRQRELERDADGGEILVRRRTPGALGIEHRVRRRQRPARQMVVADDDVDALRLQLGDRADARWCRSRR